MGKACQCDRCGELYLNPKSTFNLYITHSHKGECLRVNFDLCEGCYADLVLWSAARKLGKANMKKARLLEEQESEV